MSKTSIEWTATVNPDGSITPGKTWNPIRGCSRVSEGCRNCYAERQAARFAGDGLAPDPEDPKGEAIMRVSPSGTFHGFVTKVNGHPAWTGKVELIESKLREPLTWRKPARVFVNSMSDLFHEALRDMDIARIFHVMDESPNHTFQVLTKRPERMLEWVGGRGHAGYRHPWPLPNVWLGVSVEDRKNKDRIDLLRQIPAVRRFVSLEPHLEDLGKLDLTGIHWAIVGGESGPGARPFDIQWARNTVQQCKAAGVACFVKQLGAKPEKPQGCGDCDPCSYGQPCMIAYNVAMELKDRKGGDMEEWPADLRVREFPG